MHYSNFRLKKFLINWVIKAMNKEIDFFLILSLVLLVPALVFANQNKNEQQQSQQSEKLMQERLKNSEEKTNIKLKALEEKIKDQNRSVNNELGLRAEALEKRMDMYLSFVLIFLTTIGFLITFFGRKAISEWIKQAIRSKTEEEINKYEDLLKKQGEEAVNSLISELKKKGKDEFAEIESLRSEYEDTLNHIKNIELNVSKPLSDEAVESLDQFKEKLFKVKSEDNYSFDDWYYKGVDEYENQDYEGAIRSFTKGLGKDPNFVDTYIYRGNCFDKLDQYEDAIKDFSEAIRLDPDYSQAYFNRAKEYTHLKLYEEAMKDYKKAINIDPIWVKPYLNLIETFIITTAYKEALTYIENGLALANINIKDQAIFAYLACISKRLLNEEYSESEMWFNEIIENEFEVTGSFDAIEEWLQNSKISKEDKKYIIDKTDLLKKHAKKVT